MAKVMNSNGTEVEYRVAETMMDNSIREELHRELAPTTEQEFFAAYAKKHEEVFGEEWEMDKKNPEY